MNRVEDGMQSVSPLCLSLLGLLIAACGPPANPPLPLPEPEHVHVVAETLPLPSGDTQLLGAVSVEVRHEGGPETTPRHIRGAPLLVPADDGKAPTGLEVLTPLTNWSETSTALAPGESVSMYLRYLRMEEGGPETVRMRVLVNITDHTGAHTALSEPFDLPWSSRPVARPLGAEDLPAEGGGPVLVALRIHGDGSTYALDVGMDGVARSLRLAQDGGTNDPDGFHQSRVVVAEALALRDALRDARVWELSQLRPPQPSETPPHTIEIELFAVTGHAASVARFASSDPGAAETWPALRAHLDELRQRIGRRARKGPR